MKIRVGIFALCLAGPAQAQADLTHGCSLMWQGLAERAGPALSGRFAGTDGDWCVIRRVSLKTGDDPAPVISAEVLYLRGPLEDWVASGSFLPAAMEARAEGLKIEARTAKGMVDYLYRGPFSLTPITATVFWAWDASDGLLKLTKFDVDFPGNNALSLVAEVSGVDLGSKSGLMASAALFSVRKAEVVFLSNGMIDGYAALAAGQSGSFGKPVDPAKTEASRETGKSLAAAVIAGLPDTAVAADSKAALTAFVRAYPHPAGRLKLKVTADPGLGPLRFVAALAGRAPEKPEDWVGMLAGIGVSAEWAAGATE